MPGGVVPRRSPPARLAAPGDDRGAELVAPSRRPAHDELILRIYVTPSSRQPFEEVGQQLREPVMMTRRGVEEPTTPALLMR